MKSSSIKGALFEIVVLKLVLMSGYSLIDDVFIDGRNIIKKGKRIYEFKGRGEFHQIDVPVDLNYRPCFTYPIRLLGETKFYRYKLDKSFIRHEIGKMKDIQENYFVTGNVNEEMRQRRRLEIFAFFAANGFNLGAENLAYAHGIKTISYENNYCIRKIIIIIETLTEMISELSDEEQSEFIDNFYDCLICGSESLGFSAIRQYFSTYLDDTHIRTSIIGTTSTGLTINFLSEDDFPSQLFKDKDYVYCRIISNGKKEWYAELQNTNFRLYFSMPKIILKESFEKDGVRLYPKKAHEFEKIFFKRNIDGISRDLELRFDYDWFDEYLE